MVSFELFKAGKSVGEIARERNLVAGTILGHLAHFVGTGEIELDKLVSKEKQLLIKLALEKHGSSGHKVVLESLPEDYTYGDIKMVLASVNIPGS